MSKAPETIYINRIPNGPVGSWYKERANDGDIAYVHHSIAYGYASQVERLRALLKEYARHKSDCQRYGRMQCTCGFAAHQVETMASDALTKEG